MIKFTLFYLLSSTPEHSAAATVFAPRRSLLFLISASEKATCTDSPSIYAFAGLVFVSGYGPVMGVVGSSFSSCMMVFCPCLRIRLSNVCIRASTRGLHAVGAMDDGSGG
ncbi:hypothetical protein K491DRAFT_173118 [Lophiostoma macrostomum CBS 122681]|uniref:Uncharacterized protein n=1 Tax=Lophiostoma macrostomum CBS 122681 TaxID=1314788 RepID=A0A6A6STA7_9PLEO|nr:hypothetical protein K491DRAFT_173118 [Lophiostoma macrostomum CBS 122681]